MDLRIPVKEILKLANNFLPELTEEEVVKLFSEKDAKKELIRSITVYLLSS